MQSHAGRGAAAPLLDSVDHPSMLTQDFTCDATFQTGKGGTGSIGLCQTGEGDWPNKFVSVVVHADKSGRAGIDFNHSDGRGKQFGEITGPGAMNRAGFIEAPLIGPANMASRPIIAPTAMPAIIPFSFDPLDTDGLRNVASHCSPIIVPRSLDTDDTDPPLVQTSVGLVEMDRCDHGT